MLGWGQEASQRREKSDRYSSLAYSAENKFGTIMAPNVWKQHLCGPFSLLLATEEFAERHIEVIERTGAVARKARTVHDGERFRF